MKIEKKHKIQIKANDFNGFNNLFFRSVCNLLFVIFDFLGIFSPFLWHSSTKDMFHCLHKDFLVNLLRNILLKLYDIETFEIILLIKC